MTAGASNHGGRAPDASGNSVSRISDSLAPNVSDGLVSDVLRRLHDVVRASGAEIEVRQIPIDEIVVSMPRRCLRQVVMLLLTELGFRHLSAITGDDLGRRIVLRYHFWRSRPVDEPRGSSRAGLTLEADLASEGPRISTLVDLIPGAAFYEREVYGMLDVDFEGHAELRPLLLAEDWDGPPPLRLGGRMRREAVDE